MAQQQNAKRQAVLNEVVRSRGGGGDAGAQAGLDPATAEGPWGARLDWVQDDAAAAADAMQQ